MMLTRPLSGDGGSHDRMSGGGLSLAQGKLSTSRRDDDDEEKLRRAEEKAKVIGAGRTRRAKRVA